MIIHSKNRSTTISLTIIALLSTATSQAKVQDIRSADAFSTIITSGNPTLVKFYADYCGACKKSKQPFEEVSEEAEFANITFANVDTQAQQDIANQYSIEGIPTFIYFINGTPVDKTSGVHPHKFKENLRNDIHRNLMPNAQPKTESVTSVEIVEAKAMPAPEGQGFFAWLKNFFMMLFIAIKNVIMSIFNWIKGLFNR